MMAATELDPLFLKALKLLHSRSKDAASQLKQMYYDVVAKKRSNWNGKKIDDEENTRSSKHSGKRAEDLEAKKKEAEKRKLEKLKQELDDLSQDSLHPKKPKLDSSGSEKESKDRHKHDRKKELQEREKTTDSDSDSEESWIKEKERELAEREKEESGHSFGGFNSSESDSGSDTDVPDPEDHGLDLMDITCVVCQTFDVSSGNQLVECQDCHSLYHQECHRPTVSDKEVQDPRCVWYCSKCSKNMKKMVSSKNQKLKSGSSSVSSSGKESTASGKSASKPEASAAPFKRTEITKTSSIGGKESSSSSSTSTSKQVPFAALSTLVALSSKDSAKQKPVEASSKQKSTSGLDPNKPGSFLFADPIRIKSTSSSSSKSGEGKVSLSASAKAEAAQRSANKPIDNTKYIGLGKSSSGSTKSSSGSSMHKSSSSSAMMGQTSSSKALQRSVSSSVGSSASGSASGVSSGGGSSSSSSSVNAEKRLQMMKKKANAKQIMKRTPIK